MRLGWANRRLVFGWQALLGFLAAVGTACLFSSTAAAQWAVHPPDSVVPRELIGLPVQEVRVAGNANVSSQVILNLVRTHEGDKFDPATVQEDYQRIYGLRRFSDVQADVEPTRDGKAVIVIFQVTEEKLIRSIKFVGNDHVGNGELEKAIDLKVGEAIEPFRITLAKNALISTYQSKNYSLAHVEVSMEDVLRTGDVTFHIVEGPNITIRKIDFIGAKSYTKGKLNDQVKSTRWYWFFNAGTYDPQTVDDDVASLNHFYQSRGFFDVRVGRKLIFSPDQTELQIDFVIDEGVRYKVDRVSFTGNTSLTEAQLRANLNLVEGTYFDADVLQRDVHSIVTAYSPLGYIYNPQSTDPNYLRIGKPDYPFAPVRLIWHRQPGTVELVYEIAEGRPFRIGNIFVTGNAHSMDKLVRRELHVTPGQLYNSGELQDAVDRLQGTPYFKTVTITPIGDQPDTRDLLIHVEEQHTAQFSFGAGITSNAGVQGNLVYEQKNFDLGEAPNTWRDLFSDRAFTGAGQLFRVSLEPGTEFSSASILFSEPYLFDQPYSMTDELYYQDYIREAWDEARAGARITLGKRLNYIWSTSVTLRGENVDVHDIQDYAPLNERITTVDPVTGLPVIGPDGFPETHLRTPRAPQVIELAGNSQITSANLEISRDTTNRGPLLFRGTSTTLDYFGYGALGGQFYFQKFAAAFNAYQTLAEDLVDRKTVLALHLNGGYILGDAPFYEKFYGGGIGSVRGFEYRGISPRAGRDLDPVGGDLNLVGTVELNYPIYGESLRGVVFTDVGTVEQDIRIYNLRASVGFGIRLVLPFLPQAPIALDFAIPVAKTSQDQVQFFSFAFGSNF